MPRILKDALGQFRVVSIAEGISYLILLFLAMPVKYLLGEPSLVSIFGSIHGFLFVVFMAALLRVAVVRQWVDDACVDRLWRLADSLWCFYFRAIT